MSIDSPHLSQITTRWTLLARAAQRADADAARRAQAELLYRYLPAVYRYLSAAAGPAADDLGQEFALRFVRGDLRRARPGRGRFRDEVRAELAELVEEHKQRPAPDSLSTLPADPAVDPDKAFQAQWRREVLAQAWAGLAAEGGRDRPTVYDVLRRKADAPSRTSAQLAADLTAECGRPVTAANVRQLVHRGRERFAAGLRRIVSESLGSADPAMVDDELAALGLLGYCR